MKKIMFAAVLIFAALSLSACTDKAAVPASQINVSVNNLINNSAAIDNASGGSAVNSHAPAANVATTSSQAEEAAAPVETQINMKTLEGQKDLFAQYSQAVIKTSYGNITVKLYGTDSPKTVNNFLNLAQQGFYNGTKFHRVIADFMIQGGDPLSKESDTSVWGTGGPSYRFEDEFNSHKLVAGSLAMANAGSNTNGSQFFIVTAAATPWLDGHHTNFGEVVAGMDVVKKIEAAETGAADRPLKDVVINSIELVK